MKSDGILLPETDWLAGPWSRAIEPCTLAGEIIFAPESDDRCDVPLRRGDGATHQTAAERNRSASSVAFGGPFKVEAERSTDSPCRAREEVSSRGLDASRIGGGGGGVDDGGGGDNSGATSCRKPSDGISAVGIRSSSIFTADRSNDCGIGAIGGGAIGAGGFGAADCGHKQSPVKSGPSALTFSSSSHHLTSSARHLTRDLAGCLRNKLACFWTMFTKRKKEEDLDETLFTTIHHRPEELGVLEKSTKFTRKEIQLIYRGFKQECPTGMVDEHAFKEIFAQFFPQGDATQYAHYVFKTFKNGNTGTINFEDFLQSLSQASRGTVQEKLRWVFCLYDLNGDGYITKAEMTSVAAAIYDMLGRFTAPAVDDLSARQHVDTIFHKIDANQDGLITFEELSQWCTREERFIKSLDMLDTVL